MPGSLRRRSRAARAGADFDIQGTLGVAIPTKHSDTLGTNGAANIALQYHLLKYLWPERLNDTWWVNGHERGGKDPIL
jgi:hypothetical protein